VDWWLDLILPIVLLLAPGIWRRRESIRFRLRVLLVGEATYLLVLMCLVKLEWPAPQALVCAVLAGMVVIALQLQRRRKRYIPRSERRRAIARFEYKTGRKYNPRIHEIDHIVPFSKGGSNTADNLRVVERGMNRAKGARSPWWDLLGRLGR
jgi:Flp pilus assembly protein TadB